MQAVPSDAFGARDVDEIVYKWLSSGSLYYGSYENPISGTATAT